MIPDDAEEAAWQDRFIEDDYEMQTECPYCGGDGWNGTEDGIAMECPECGGTGWY